MRTAIGGLVAIAAVCLFAAPAHGDSATADVTLTVEKYLSVEITQAPSITISGGDTEGSNMVGFTVKFNFVPCYYEYWCDIAPGLPPAWDLVVGTYPGSEWCGCSHGTHSCQHNTFDDLTAMHYFPNGMGLGSGGAKLTGVTLEHAAADYQNVVIGTLYFEFKEGTSPCGD